MSPGHATSFPPWASASSSIKWGEVGSSLSKDGLAQILAIKWQGLRVPYTLPEVGNGYWSEGEGSVGVRARAAGGAVVEPPHHYHHEVPSTALSRAFF